MRHSVFLNWPTHCSNCRAKIGGVYARKSESYMTGAVIRDTCLDCSEHFDAQQIQIWAEKEFHCNMIRRRGSNVR